MSTQAHDLLIRSGEEVVRTLRFSRDDIATFARMTFDENPLHLDSQRAHRARFGEIIASGQQTAAVLMGMLASHCSRSDDGVAREMLCLNMNFSFKRAVFADQEIQLQWLVTSVEWNAKLQGMIALLNGRAGVVRARPSVVARGTVLLTLARA